MLQEAIILAGGFGTRLREVVSDVPKPMAPVNGNPFLDYQLRYLKHYGIERVVLSVGHLSEKIISHYGTSFNGMEIAYSVEKEPLGTGGGVRLAMEKCKEYDVLVLNGDSFFSIDLHNFYNKYSDAVADGALALRYIDNCARYGTIILGEMDIIKAFNEKAGHKTPGIINAGVYMLSRDIYLEETEAGKNFSIEKDFFEKKLHKLTLYGFTYNGYFIDIGIPEDYKQAQHDFETFKY
ncbi:MAG: nucleotidyltransferase family protein [Bacteroidia bacterium]